MKELRKKKGKFAERPKTFFEERKKNKTKTKTQTKHNSAGIILKPQQTNGVLNRAVNIYSCIRSVMRPS